MATEDSGEAQRLRERLRQAASELRAAAAEALARDSWLAPTLDDCRVDAERLLALDDHGLTCASRAALFVRTELALRTWRKSSRTLRPPSRRQPCPICREGTLEPVARPGRSAPFRGVCFAIPEDFPIPTCDRCRAESLDDETAARLDEVLMSAWTRRS